jgi:recombination protein RecA
MSLDKALGGGYPRGRIIEVLGHESTGKSTLALHAVVEAQKLRLKCAYLDIEHSLEMTYACNLGVDPALLLVAQPNSGEEALEIVDNLVRSKELGLIIVDSVAALVPQVELEGQMDESQMGLQARLMSKAMRKLSGIAYETNTTILFTNQYRSKIGVFYGSNETSCGGNALKYYASQRLETRKTGIVGDKEGEKTGIEVKVKVIKNKCSPPFKEAEFAINFGTGIDWAKDILDTLVDKGVIKKSGASFSIGEEKIGYGEAKTIESIRSDKDLLARLKSLL